MKELHKIIKEIIFLNSQLRKTQRVEKQKTNLTPVHFAIEYATVKIDVGRQSGKSEFIRQNSDDKTLVVVRRHVAKEEYRDCPALVLTPGEITRWRHKSKGPFERIYFDEPSFLFVDRREQSEVYQILAYSDIHQTFIHIGC